MRVIVTGGCGFIGTNIVFALLNNPDVEKIVVLDKITYASNDAVRNLTYINDKVKLYIFDILNINSIDDVPKDFDYCIHLAAESHVDKSIGEMKKFTNVNALGTYEVAKFCFMNGIKMIHFSTDEVYGDLPLNAEYDDYFKESKTWPKPRNPYSTSKLFAEYMIQLAEIEFGVYENCIKLRPCNQFGPYQDVTKMVPKLITNILKGDKMPIYGHGENIREWMFVKDTARLVDKLICMWELGSPLPKVMNVGSGIDIANVDMVKNICHKMNKRPNDVIEFIVDPRGNCHDARYSVNTDIMQRVLVNFKHTPFMDALDKTINWYKEKHDGESNCSR